MTDEDWYTVRCVFRWVGWDGAPYEERITLWRAESLNDAIARAEVEAREYVRENQLEYVGLAQAYHLGEDRSPGHGAEIFSLLRGSDLDPATYVRRFFDTGEEHIAQQHE